MRLQMKFKMLIHPNLLDFKLYLMLMLTNQDHKNDNTKRKTLGHIKLLTQYLVQNGENRQIHEIPPLELDALLCKFIIGGRRKNGEEYEPSYLRGMFGSFERYLKET
jgi:hypothetical protein